MSVLVFTFGFICACAMSNAGRSKSEDSSADSFADSSAVVPTHEELQEAARRAFYVYADFKSPLNHFYPSGWMGDTRDLAFNESYLQNPFAGKTCIKVQYSPRGNDKWAGIFWQQPANNWGDKRGGFDLSKAEYITFWMKGAAGNETIAEVKIGGFKGAYPDSDSAVKKNIKLTTDWKMYWIDLRKKDMSRMAGGFSFTVNEKDNPSGCTFYIDEVRYEMSK